MAEQGPLVLTNIFTPKDKYDKFLLEKILLIVQNSITMELFKSWGHLWKYPEGTEIEYLKVITNVIRSLVKANHNRRVYNRLVKSSEKRLLKESLKAKSSLSLLYEEPDLMSEVDSFLANIKAALDSLVFSLNLVFGGVGINGLHRKGNDSVARVVATLKNLPKEKREKAKDLTTLLEDNSGFISYLVALRDSPLHRGKTANISPFKFDINTKKIIRPSIHYNPTKAEDVSDFLNRIMQEISEIVQIFIVLELSNLITDMFLVKDKKGNFIWASNTK